MPTYHENKCVADFSLPAWAGLSTVCSVQPEEHLQRIIPPAWRVVRADRHIAEGFIRVTFDNAEPLWTHTELEPLPCIGRFSSGGDEEAQVVTYAARDLHDALQGLFVKAKEPEGAMSGT